MNTFVKLLHNNEDVLKQHNSTALIKVLIKSCFYMVIR